MANTALRDEKVAFAHRRAQTIQLRADFVGDYIFGSRELRNQVGPRLLLIVSDEVSPGLALPLMDEVQLHGEVPAAFPERPRYAVFSGWAAGRVRGASISVMCLPTGLLWPEYALRALRGSKVEYLVVLADLSTIVPGIDVGELVVPSCAVRDEGLTDAHVPRQMPATTDWWVMRALIQSTEKTGNKARVGRCWSSGSWLADRGDQAWSYGTKYGVLGNSLPVSTVLTLGVLEGFRTAALCVVAENVISGRVWQYGDDREAWQAGWQSACKAALGALAGMPGQHGPIPVRPERWRDEPNT
jgi:uridine phosphorylase